MFQSPYNGVFSECHPFRTIGIPVSDFVPRVRVRYGETDQMGVVHHGNFLNYFELGRTELMRHLGFPYAELESRGMLFGVVEATCRYRASARYDDVLRVETTGRTLSPLRVRFEYRVVRESDRVLVADGSTDLVCLDPAFRPRRIPDDLAAAFARASTPNARDD